MANYDLDEAKKILESLIIITGKLKVLLEASDEVIHDLRNEIMIAGWVAKEKNESGATVDSTV